MQQKLGRALFGYSPRRVREALRAQQNEYETLLLEKQERLTALRDENLQLKQQLEAHQQRQRDIASALVEAQARARAIVEAGRSQARAEQQQAREALAAMERLLEERRQTLLQVTGNVERMARDFQAAAAQQIKVLSLAMETQDAPMEEDRSA